MSIISDAQDYINTNFKPVDISTTATTESSMGDVSPIVSSGNNYSYENPSPGPVKPSMPIIAGAPTSDVGLTPTEQAFKQMQMYQTPKIQTSAAQPPVQAPVAPQQPTLTNPAINQQGMGGEVYNTQTGQQMTPEQVAADNSTLYPNGRLPQPGNDTMFHPSLEAQRQAEAQGGVGEYKIVNPSVQAPVNPNAPPPPVNTAPATSEQGMQPNLHLPGDQTKKDLDVLNNGTIEEKMKLALTTSNPDIKHHTYEGLHQALERENIYRKEEVRVKDMFEKGDSVGLQKALRDADRRPSIAGDIVKSLIFGFGHNGELASQYLKRAFGDYKVEAVQVGNENYMAKLDPVSGEYISATQNGKPVDSSTLSSINEQASSMKDYRLDSTRQNLDNGHTISVLKNSKNGKVQYRDDTTGSILSTAPARLGNVGTKNPATAASMRLIENEIKKMQNANMEASRVPGTTLPYTQAQIDELKQDLANMGGGLPGQSITPQAVAPQTTTTQGNITPNAANANLKTVIGGPEGGEAGYNAIYGYANAGGDKSIPASHGGKNLSELTIGEALKIGDSRMGNNAGALGKYQFLPGTLRSAMKTAGLDESAQFNKDNQDKLFDALVQDNTKALKSVGITPTDTNLYLAHAVGAGNVSKLLDPANQDKIAADLLGYAQGSVARKTNPQLEAPVKDYVATIAGRTTGRVSSETTPKTTEGKWTTPEANNLAQRNNTADKIASYEIDPNSIPAKTRGAVMADVLKINPDYSQAKYSAAKKTREDFAITRPNSGGGQLQAVNRAIPHLEQYQKAVEALNNGNMPLANKILQEYKLNLGDSNVAGAKAIQSLVSTEVQKAVAGGLGGVEERRDLSHQMATTLNPQQLAQVIKEYQGLMIEQARGLRQNWTSNGLPAKEFDGKLVPKAREVLDKHDRTDKNPRGNW
jgi:hypothetical protein